MNYIVRMDGEVLKAKVDEHMHSIWMCRTLREKPIDEKPGIYILIDSQGYCCYVGQTSGLQGRMRDHRNERKLFWWTHTVYFLDENPDGAFLSKDHREWYEKSLKEAVEFKHPTFTNRVGRQPRKPNGGESVLKEMLDLLKVIGFDAKVPAPTTTLEIEHSESHHRQADRRPRNESRTEPSSRITHRPPLGAWPNYTALAKAIAERRGMPGTAGGILQKLTNFWIPSRGRYAKANPETRQLLESFGVKFDGDGFVKSCASVPFPLS